MVIPEKIFKSYDIRGIYPSEINEENVPTIVKAIYSFLTRDFPKDKKFQFALARDMRLSSPSLYDLAKKTLVELGATVIDLGLLPTPSFYFSVYNYKYDGGFMITASHNPKEYNGMKIVKNTPNGILKVGSNTGLSEIKKMCLQGVAEESKGLGEVTENKNVLSDEVKVALKLAGNPKIKPFKVIADPGNGMGELYIKELFKNIPGELVEMNFGLDGTFPNHHPDPMVPENIADLQKKIVETGADMGLAPDGDADRLFILDEKGEVVSASVITSLIAKDILKDHPGAKFVVDIKRILNARKNIEASGGELLVSKTGHANMTEMMQKNGALFGGEASAHYYFKSAGGAENQVPVIVFLLKKMTEEGKKLSDIADEYRKAYEADEINFEVENQQEVIEAVQNKFKDGEVSNLDGVAISYPDLRINLRPSGTEPLIRLNVESTDQEKLERVRAEVIELIHKTGKFINTPNH